MSYAANLKLYIASKLDTLKFAIDNLGLQEQSELQSLLGGQNTAAEVCQ
jgi:hypothetical protein